MSSGKRPRPSTAMNRTTSMSVLSPALVGSDPAPDPNPRQRQRTAVDSAAVPAMAPPPETMALPVDAKAAVGEAEFLRACGICKRNLGPGKDTFIYRGDAAFCSVECREKQMKLDTLKERLSRMARKSDVLTPESGQGKASRSSDPVAAA